jgi:hypothetical protein
VEQAHRCSWSGRFGTRLDWLQTTIYVAVPVTNAASRWVKGILSDEFQ